VACQRVIVRDLRADSEWILVQVSAQGHSLQWTHQATISRTLTSSSQSSPKNASRALQRRHRVARNRVRCRHHLQWRMLLYHEAWTGPRSNNANKASISFAAHPGFVNHFCDSFPGQGHNAGIAKIPTIMYYDQTGNVRCAGAESETGSNTLAIAREGWIKAEWFAITFLTQSLGLK
jgi:hypothetical protein